MQIRRLLNLIDICAYQDKSIFSIQVSVESVAFVTLATGAGLGPPRWRTTRSPRGTAIFFTDFAPAGDCSRPRAPVVSACTGASFVRVIDAATTGRGKGVR